MFADFSVCIVLKYFIYTKSVLSYYFDLQVASLPRVFRLFRALGLRHLIIVDDMFGVSLASFLCIFHAHSQLFPDYLRNQLFLRFWSSKKMRKRRIKEESGISSYLVLLKCFWGLSTYFVERNFIKWSNILRPHHHGIFFSLSFFSLTISYISYFYFYSRKSTLHHCLGMSFNYFFIQNLIFLFLSYIQTSDL